jgi:hypothetical protein
MAKLLGIGNPILDISAPVPADLLTKYALREVQYAISGLAHGVSHT